MIAVKNCARYSGIISNRKDIRFTIIKGFRKESDFVSVKSELLVKEMAFQ